MKQNLLKIYLQMS